MKYKLKKIYPGSPTEVGYEVEVRSGQVHKWPDIQTSPEYWEFIPDVVEPDWKIVGIEYNKKLYTISKKDSKELHAVDGSGHCLVEQAGDGIMYGYHYVNIHSVKNTKTGEVLTVGDWVERNIEGAKNPSYKSHQIQKFTINEYNHCLVHTEQYKKGIGIAKVHKVVEPKKLILTTIDEVAIYEGDKFWAVYPNWEEADYIAISTDTGSGTWKTFSTVEGRNNWITENKPMYSIADIRGAAIELGWGNISIEAITKKLKKQS